MARVKDLWWTSTTPRRKTSRHPDKGGSKTAKRWLAVWVGPDGKEASRAFVKKVDAEKHGTAMEADALRGTYIDPKTARTTVAQWCETWLKGYATRRKSTVRQARTHIARITAEFGSTPLPGVRPSQIRSWTARLHEEGLAVSYVYALHARLSQVMADAVRDGMIAQNPCSRWTSPGTGKQRAYVATTEQVWALYEAMPERYRASILLGAFVGLRIAEACGQRVDDVDFMRGIVHPRFQFPAEPLKTETSRTPVPISRMLATEYLAPHVERWPAETLLTADPDGGQLEPWRLERAFRTARGKVDGLPAGFRFQDLRHYFASLLIASGADVKVVQARVRHASAKTTLDVYGHLWPDRDESTREAVDAVLMARTEQGRNTKTAR
ncbi:tyrosine-type recombinase/integrase [Actinoallomurus oryzae]|uniref:Tyrosine-type recombinase/integrase n=1 Tax=Actinoallomurus oryzae TaxID=502180 RepID=A0ABP8R5B5_9ACTN